MTKMLVPQLTSAPAALVLTLAEIKAHVRVDTSDEDTFLTNLGAAANEHLDGWDGLLGKALITQTWRADFDKFPGVRRIGLPIGPVQTVVVKYSDSDNAEQTWASSKYAVHEDNSEPFLWLDQGQDSWPATYDRRDAVRIETVVGYGAASTNIPEPIRQAMLLMVGDAYRNRETVAVGIASKLPVSMATEALLVNYRRLVF